MAKGYRTGVFSKAPHPNRTELLTTRETMSKALWAPVKWAQRADSIYVTVDLPDVKDEKVKLDNKSLTFR